MNLMDLLIKIKADSSEADKAMEDTESKGSSMASKVASAFGTVAKVAVAGVAASATAIAGLATASIKAYASYEQLVGGVETLFGTGGQDLVEYAKSVGKTTGEVTEEYFNMLSAQETVMNNASNAYKTAGLSANEYMEQVTSFAASLTSSLEGDTKAAADKADMAITDMADNANKMGTSMEAIQNAYNGFSKQNYTMLDNLKLGYGGTKEEMERLLADAQKISGIKYDVSNYADIVDAIHVVQNEMGITGTTAREAATTIEGSLGMMKSAWANLVAGISDEDADFGSLISNMVESVEAFADNIIPRIQIAMEGIGQMLTEMLPVILEEFLPIINDFLPKLLEAGSNMITTLLNGMSQNFDHVIETIMSILEVLVDCILTNLPMIIECGLQMITTLALGIAEAIPELIPTIIEVIIQIVEMLTDPDNLENLITAALAIMVALAEGLIMAIPQLLEAVPTIFINLVTAIVQNLPRIVQAGVQIIQKLKAGITSVYGLLISAGIEIVMKVKDGFIQKVNEAKQWGMDLIQNFIDGVLAKWEALKQTVANVAASVKSYLGFSEPEEGPLSNFHTYAPDMMELFAKGIRDNEHIVTDQIAKSFNFGEIGTFEISRSSIRGFDGELGAGATFNQTINVNQEISTADELARAVRIESRYGLMRGVALG